MNISRLRELLKFMPDNIAPEDLADALADELVDEMLELAETIKETRRAHDLAKLAEMSAAVAEMQARLGLQTAPVKEKPTKDPNRDMTDDDMDIGNEDEGLTAADFRAELSILREHTAEKRRRTQ